MVKAWILLGLLLGCWLIAGGQATHIELRDARTGEAIGYAHLSIENLPSGKTLAAVTDIRGKASIQLENEKGRLSVSALGYQAFNDTIKKGVSHVFRLQPFVYNMDEVVVTGQYTPQPLDQSIFRVKVIGARQISRKASNNLGELVAGELNIRTSVDGALGSKITLQGLGGEHVKFLIDGVPLIGRMNGNIDLGQLNLYNVKQIEIIEGPMSVIYGSNALAGVINIITNDSDQARLTAQLNSYLETVGVYNFNGNLSMSKKRWSGSLAASRNFFDGYSPVDTARSKRWKPKRQLNADANLQYTHKDLRARFTTSFFDELLKDKGNLLRPYYETAFDSDFNTYRNTTRFEGANRVFKDRFLTVVGSYSHYKRIKNTYFIDLTTLEKNLTANTYDQDTSSFNQYLLRAEFSKSTKESFFNYQLGVDLNHEDGFGRRMLGLRQAMGDYAAFASIKVQANPRLMLQPGARYAYNTRYKAPLVYSLNLKWDISEHLTSRASYAKGFRAPSLKELYLEFVDVNHNIRGNEQLAAEHSQNINFAIKYHKEKNTYDYGIELSAFSNNIRNSITLAAISSETSLYTYVNLYQMRSQGVLLQFNNRIYPWLELKLGIGETGRKQSSGRESEVDMVYSTDITANLNYFWRKTGINGAVFYKYNGAYPEVFVNQSGQVFQTIMEAYHTMDISLQKRFFRNSLSAQAGIKNVFNNTTIAIKGNSGGGGIHSGGGGPAAVGWGRTVFFGLSYQLQQMK